MNVSTGHLTYIDAAHKEMMEGMRILPKRLHPFAEAHMSEHPGQPVDLDGDSELAQYACKQRVKGAFGKCKNRPA